METALTEGGRKHETRENLRVKIYPRVIMRQHDMNILIAINHRINRETDEQLHSRRLAMYQFLCGLPSREPDNEK